MPHSSAPSLRDVGKHFHLAHALSMAALVLFGIWYGFYSWQETRSFIQFRLGVLAHVVANASDTSFREYAHGLTLLGPALLQADALDHPAQARQMLLKFPLTYQSATHGGLCVIRMDGQVIAANDTRESPPLPNLSRDPTLWRHYLQAARTRSVVMGAAIFHRTRKEWVIPMTYAVRNSAGIPQFFLTSSIPVAEQQTFWEQLARIKLVVGLLHTDGMLVARWPLPTAGKAALGTPRIGSVMQAMENGPQTRNGFFDGHLTLDGHAMMLGAYERLRHFPMAAFVGMPLRTFVFQWWGRVWPPFLMITLMAGFNLFTWGRAGMRERQWRRARETLEAELRLQATHDPLTGLPNRALFLDRLTQAITDARRERQHIALLLLDLDSFKEVNDRLGHAAGDRLLREVAERLKRHCRESDTLARLGGDEFVILLTGLHQDAEITTFLERLMETFQEPVPVGAEMALVSASIGAAIYPIDSGDPENLLRHADLAMYQAKGGGGHGYRFYDAEIDRTIHAQHVLRERLAQALARDEFRLHYQPMVHLGTAECIGVEALLRWEHPEDGLRAAGTFLPAIENTDLMYRLECWVLETAVRQAAQWQREGHPLLVSINVSRAALRHPGFPEQLRSAFVRHPEARGLLEIELLETVNVGDLGGAEPVLATCRELGIPIALDDFGTGGSSLVHLQEIPAQTIKIDQRFVMAITQVPENMAIIEAVCTFGRIAGRRIIAEGVESVALGKILLRSGRLYGQGYAIAHPMPASEIMAWRENWRPDPEWQDSHSATRPDTPFS